ncbi:MAG: adenine nucleotide alpha hydrolase [Chitinophagaceae bacterium]|nr:adenine nucleotide alpha hydrolase [Chitinophagaceae bacterium]
MEKQNHSKAFLSWSGGKDSAMALHSMLSGKTISIQLLLTTMNAANRRISIHGVREELLRRQAQALNIPVRFVPLPDPCSNEEYENAMEEALCLLKQNGFHYGVFGDIFLEEIKQYRIRQMQRLNMECVFPLWGRDSHALVRQFISEGFKAVVVSVKASVLDASFAGRLLDESFLNDLPAGTDPCGENGEFHSFCFDGPVFRHPVFFTVGERVYKEYAGPNGAEGYWFCDLM